MMSKVSSLISSSLKTKDPMKIVDDLKTTSMNKKPQCDLCKLSYSTEKELLEHSVSLLHHTKLDDRKDNSIHECKLCEVTCTSMADYRKHSATDSHQKRLSDLRGNDERSSQMNESRKNSHAAFSYSQSSTVSDKEDLNKHRPRYYNVSQRTTEAATHNKAFNNFGRSYPQGSDYKPDQIRANEKKQSHAWSKGKWKERYPLEDHSWLRESLRDKEFGTNAEMKGFKEEQVKEQQDWQYHGPGYNNGYGNYQDNSEYSRLSRDKEEGMKNNHSFYNSNFIDFTSDDIPADWDDKSFSEHERFIAGMYKTSFSSKYKPHLGQGSYIVGRWETTNTHDRKRPHNENDAQDSLAPKSSRSFDSSSDEHIPVKDVPMRHLTSYASHAAHRNPAATDVHSGLSLPSKMISIDEASNNVLERAERLCKELREKREESQLKGNLLLKKQEHESVNKTISSLVQKQQTHKQDEKKATKGEHDKHKIKSYRQSSSSVSAHQNKSNGFSVSVASKNLHPGSGASTIKAKVPGKMMNGINKSEKVVLKNQEKPLPNSKNLPPSQSKSGPEESNRKEKMNEKDAATGISGRLLSKPQPKSHLSKDNLKKIVNTPYSRDERLQLAKMLQSRGRQRTLSSSSRSSVQLDGLHDLVLSSNDVNLDTDENSSSQPLMLEDLPKNVCQQILDLLDGDSSIHSEKNRTSPDKLQRKVSDLHTDVIVLSDDEVPINKGKYSSGTTDSSSFSDSRKINISKKSKEDKPVSKNGFMKSVDYPVASQINQPGNLRPTTPVQQLSASKNSNTFNIDSDEDVSYSSGHGYIRETYQKEKLPHELSNDSSSKRSFNISPSVNEQRQISRKDVHSHRSLVGRNQGDLNSFNVMEKFPLLMSCPKFGRTASSDKENGTAPSLNFDFCMNQNASDKNPNTMSVSTDNNRSCRSPLPDTDVTCSQQPSTFLSSSSSSQAKFSLESHKRVLSHNKPQSHLRAQAQSLANLDMLSSNNESSVLSVQEASLTKPAQLSSDILPSRDLELSVANCIAAYDAVHNNVNRNVLGDSINTAASLKPEDLSTVTMSKLLALSEKEENVKQEKISIDQKLSRLHRLLEQAVVQINKCTERISQLHEEEQELTKRRLLLLRGATSTKPSWRSEEKDSASHFESASIDSYSVPSFEPANSLDPMFASCRAPAITDTSSALSASTSVGRTDASSADTSISPGRTEHSKGSFALSRSDWLAKFSSFLPHDPTSGIAKQPASTLSDPFSRNQEHLSNNQPTYSPTSPSVTTPFNLSLTQPMPEREKSLYEQVDEVNNKREEVNDKKQNPAIHLPQHESGGTFPNSHRGVARLQTSKSYISGNVVTSVATSASAAATSERSFNSFITAPIMYVGSFRSADPSALKLLAPVVLDRSAHDPMSNKSTDFNPTSVSMVSDSRTISNGTVSVIAVEPPHLATLSGAQKIVKGHEHSGDDSDIGSIASASSLGEQISRYCRGTPGASLNAKDPFGGHELSVIMSDAKSLDSQEEEDEDNKMGSLCRKEVQWNHGEIDSVKDDLAKTVKPCSVLLERLDPTQLTRRTGNYNSLSEEVVKSAEAQHLLERNFESSHGQSSSTSTTEKRKKRKTRQQRDTKGYTIRRNYLIISSSSSSEDDDRSACDMFDINPSSAASRLKRTEQSCLNQHQMKVSRDGCQSSVGEQPGIFSSSKTTISSSIEHDYMKGLGAEDSGRRCRYPSVCGPVFDIWVVRGELFVGHVNRAIIVYNMGHSEQDKIVRKYYFSNLQCMTIREQAEMVTLILGDGGDLVFCHSNERDQSRHSLDATVTCLLLLGTLVYIGLDTGEICIFDTVRMTVKDRCICSDCPIRCLAAGQEGAIKLLCVSSQDGTIIIVNANQCLPIRILMGHTKTAFSIQVEGSMVFSGSGDHTVLIQNLHTAAVEHVYNDSKGLIKSICYSRGYLFAGGMDKLVRCYNTRTHQMLQVYYGADRGVITKILVHGNLLITGNVSGSVDIVEIDLGAQHQCHVDSCGLNFGNQLHLSWHLKEDHSIPGSNNT